MATASNTSGKSDGSSAARLGVVSAVLGALLGGGVSGILSNWGLANQFANERSAELDDTRRRAYVNYLKVVDDAYLASSAADLEADLQRADATVKLLADEEVQSVSDELTTAALTGVGDIPDLRHEFIEAAQEERKKLTEFHFLWW